METKIEGIVLNKKLYRDRDLIADVLLRSGRKVAVVFFGGRGGGNKRKSSIIEVGYLLTIELKKPGKKKTDLHTAKECNTKWFHRNIRGNHQAFYLMCFYVELIRMCSADEDLNDIRNDDVDVGLFRVLSNGIFHLEKATEDKTFNTGPHFFLFLTKLIFELGIGPQLDGCLFCSKNILELRNVAFHLDQGGFVCRNCSDEHHYNENHMDLWSGLGQAWNIRYAEYEKVNQSLGEYSELLNNYLCHQMQLDNSKLKSLMKMVL